MKEYTINAINDCAYETEYVKKEQAWERTCTLVAWIY